ncbi:MAG: serpin family protein [Clostridia bacterium]|nr:serpin family protein [Clostridia bacterium]
MKNTLKRLAAAVIAAVTLVSLFGCLKNQEPLTVAGSDVLLPLEYWTEPVTSEENTDAPVTQPAESEENTDVFVPQPVVPAVLAAPTNGNVTGFALDLFRATAENGKNTLISPLSVLYALAMTANGAKGQTLTEMENVLGMEIDGLNSYLHDYMASLPRAEKYKLSAANSIWFTDDERFSVVDGFLQLNEEYYGADVYRVPFDGKTLGDINGWVNEKTDGMIEKILDEIDPYSVMYLINALAFDAEWETIYNEYQVREGDFTPEGGAKKTVEFMYSQENAYLEDEKATGFVKYYAGRKYAFVALLPNEGVTVSDYVASLDGEKLYGMLSNPSAEDVNVAIPKFETEYDVTMNDVLIKMGMPTAFNADKADFSGIGTYRDGGVDLNLFIGNVLHKTFMAVNERGTKAGAVTVVNVYAGSALPVKEPKRVILDRPFLYMLVDCENNLPFFIGTMYDAGK